MKLARVLVALAAAGVALAAIVAAAAAVENPAVDEKAIGKAAQEAKEAAMAATDGGPRKTIVGTSMYPMWGTYPGLEKRLEQLGGLVDEMAAKARKRYGRGLDIAALPEVAVSGGLPLGPKAAFPIEGKVLDAFAAKARQHHCYITVPMVAAETAGGKKTAYNICALVGRKGELVGVYRKVHVVAGNDNEILEGGCLPGKDFPVFQCDFGKVAFQICFDVVYDDGWETLGKKGAELVIWSTQSPGQIRPASHAVRNGYFVLTSTWRNNASLLDPMGVLIRAIVQKETTERVFVEEIDLEYRLIPWQPKLRNGAALREEYGDKVGFRYSEAEDGGIFWSNDPAVPIGRMARELGLTVGNAKVERDRKLQDAARGGPPCLD